MTAALPEAVRAAGTAIEVWFQDEARVGQQGTLSYVWAEKGSRQVAPGANAVLVCDGAGWHKTDGRLQVPENITLLHRLELAHGRPGPHPIPRNHALDRNSQNHRAFDVISCRP